MSRRKDKQCRHGIHCACLFNISTGVSLLHATNGATFKASIMTLESVNTRRPGRWADVSHLGVPSVGSVVLGSYRVALYGVGECLTAHLPATVEFLSQCIPAVHANDKDEVPS